MSATEASKLEAQLAKAIHDDSPKQRILNIAERLLAIQPRNVAALQAKVVSCLLRDKFGAALTLLDLLEDANPKISKTSVSFVFRKAFSLYRLQRYPEGKAIIQAAGAFTKNHIPCRHLLAQIHYNLEEFGEAASMYESILQDGAYRDDQERVEVISNLSAAFCGHNPAKAVEIVRSEGDRTHDICYNVGTALISSGNLESGMKMLVLAESLCAQEHHSIRVTTLDTVVVEEAAYNESFQRMSVDSEERNYFFDVASIWVQMAYVWQMTGETEKAIKALNLVLSLKPQSDVTYVTATINHCGLSSHRDFFEASRKLKAALNPKTLYRLTSRQLLSLRYNAALLYLHSGGLSNCHKELELLRRHFPQHPLTHALHLALTADELFKKKKTLTTEECESMASQVEAAAASNPLPTTSSDLKLLRSKSIASQVFLKQGDFKRAAEALVDEHGPLSQLPSVVSTIASWKVQTEDIADATRYLQQRVSEMPPAIASKVLYWTVHFLATTRGRFKEVSELFEYLWANLSWMKSSKDMLALRCYVLTFSNLPEAQKIASSFVSAGQQPAHSGSIDVPSRAKLESHGYSKTAEAAVKAPQTQRKRVRKMRRPPKSMEGKCDPERWIPMNLRSYMMNLPGKRKRELRRLRAIEQERLRRIAEKRKTEEAA